MEVVEQDHQGALGRRFRQQRGHCIEESKAGLFRVEGGGRWKIREAVLQVGNHLKQRRCEGTQGCGDDSDIRRLDVGPDDLHPRPECRRAFAFAAPPQQNDRSVVAYGRSEFFDRACLSDPGLAGDEHELGSSREGSFERGVEGRQLALAADEDGPADLSSGCARTRKVRLSVRGAGGDLRDFGNEAVAAAAMGLDEDGAGRIVAEGLAYGRDAGRDRRAAHRRCAPYLSDQLVLRDQPVPVVNQVREDVEDPRSDVDDLASAPKLVERGVELEIAEDVDRHRSSPLYTKAWNPITHRIRGVGLNSSCETLVGRLGAPCRAGQRRISTSPVGIRLKPASLDPEGRNC